MFRRIATKLFFQFRYKKNQSAKFNLDSKDFHRILCFIDYDTSLATIQEIQKLFDFKNINIQMIPCSIEQKKQPFDGISLNNFNWFGTLNRSINQKYKSENFDIFINLFQKSNYLFERASLQFNCKLKVRFDSNYSNFYNFVLLAQDQNPVVRVKYLIRFLLQ